MDTRILRDENLSYSSSSSSSFYVTRYPERGDALCRTVSTRWKCSLPMSPSHARYHFSLRARRLLERLFKLHCYTFRGNGIGIETGGGGGERRKKHYLRIAITTHLSVILGWRLFSPSNDALVLLLSKYPFCQSAGAYCIPSSLSRHIHFPLYETSIMKRDLTYAYFASYNVEFFNSRRRIPIYK